MTPPQRERRIFSTLSDWMRTNSSLGERERSTSLRSGQAISGESTNLLRFEEPRNESLVSSGGASFTISDAKASLTDGLHVT